MLTAADVIAVTGANGFVGSALCRDLAARGATVRPLARATGYALAGPPPDVAGCRAVVHCAHDPADARANVDGTLRLLAACRAGGVGQFVYVSSLAAHAGAASVYGRTKWELERALRSPLPADREGEPTLTILKPGTVLGPGGLFARVRQLARLPALPVFYGRGRLQTVLVDDLCAAVAAAIDRRVGGALVVAEPAGVPVAEFYRAVAALDGRRPWLVPVPGGLALAAARVAERAGLRLPVTADNLLGLKHLARFDPGPTAALLGVVPRDFAAALRSLADPPNEPHTGGAPGVSGRGP